MRGESVMKLVVSRDQTLKGREMCKQVDLRKDVCFDLWRGGMGVQVRTSI